MTRKKTLLLIILVGFTLFCLVSLLQAEPTGPPLIRITLSGSDLRPGGMLQLSLHCLCSSGCGSVQPGDDIYLHRLASGWNSMGEWYGLGRMRAAGPLDRMSLYSLPIPATIQPADDYVVTIYYGDDNCWGRSATFAIRRPGETGPSGAEIISSPRGGETFYRGNFTSIRWFNQAGWGRCSVELLKAGQFVHTFTNNTISNGREWLVGTASSWELGRAHPSQPQVVFSSYADGADFQIRVKQLDNTLRPTGETASSGMFSIASPTLRVTLPAHDAIFHPDQPLIIAWSAEHLPADARMQIIAFFRRMDGSELEGSCMPHTYDPKNLYIERGCRGNSTVWQVPTPGSVPNWPSMVCFPIRCKIQVTWVQCPRLTAESGWFTIERR